MINGKLSFVTLRQLPNSNRAFVMNLVRLFSTISSIRGVSECFQSLLIAQINISFATDPSPMEATLSVCMHNFSVVDVIGLHF